MRARFATLAFIALISALAPVACARSVSESAKSTPPTGQSKSTDPVAFAEQLVKSVYDPYATAVGESIPITLGGCFLPGGNCIGDVADYVTPDLVAQLRRSALDFDPVICAQNFPVRISYGSPVIAGPRVTIPVHTYYTMSGEATILVTVDTASGRIADLHCP